MNGTDTAIFNTVEILEANSSKLTCSFHIYLHEEAGQQSSFDVVGVGLGSKGGLRDGKLDPVQSVGQLRSNGLSCLQGGIIQEIVLAPLFSGEV